MGGAVVQFVVCAAVIVVAGTILASCSDAIADITKLGRLLVGSILLAGATSLPELSVDISAVRKNMPDLALGDLLGSCLMNLFILGILDLTRYSRGKMFSKQAAAHALSGSVAASLAALVGVALLTGHDLAKYAIFHISPFSILIAVAYGFSVRMVYLDQRIAASEKQEVATEEKILPITMTLKKAVIGFVCCAVAILITGPFLADAAGTIADGTGLGKTFVGTTLVALCTSLPELVSSIAALRMGAWDLAIGNVFGSNAFNLLLLVPLDLLMPQPIFAVVSSHHAITCLATIFATMIVIMGQLYRVELRIRFIDPDAWLVIATALGAMALLYYLPS